MLSMIAAPLLTLALAQSSAAVTCDTNAKDAGIYPPPGCVEMNYQGTCYLQCDSSPFLRPCGDE